MIGSSRIYNEVIPHLKTKPTFADIITEKQQSLLFWRVFLGSQATLQPIHHIQIQPFFCKFLASKTQLALFLYLLHCYALHIDLELKKII